MKFSKIISLASLFTLLASAVQAAVTVRSATDDTATLTFGGTVSAVSAGQTIEEGLLETNSATVVLVLENNSSLTLKPNSAIQVAGLSGPNPILTLVRGEVFGSIAGTLLIETDAGTASVSDGAFGVSTDGSTIKVDNASAVASVTPAGAPAPSPVNPGQSVSTTGDGTVSVVALTPEQIEAIQGGSGTPVVSTPEAIIIPDFEDILNETEIASNPG